MSSIVTPTYNSAEYLEGSIPSIKRQRLWWIQQESLFWTRALYERAGGINTAMKYAGDFDLWCRFARYAPLFTTNVAMGGFRVHSGQKSADVAAYRAEQGPFGWKQKIACRLRVYKILETMLLKRRKWYVDIREMPEI